MNTAIKEYARQESIVQSFADILGEAQANAYITSVLITVANSEKLQECSPVSIITSAMRAATLRLSCDPGLKQAYLVPFKGKCTLIIGYKGLHDLAVRTGQYRFINVSRIYEGEILEEDRFTGMHTLKGGKKSNNTAGYLLYFQLVNGYSKSVYMTIEEIKEHAEKYSRSYGRDDSPWKTDFDAMAKKTVLRLGLSHWGYFDPSTVILMGQVDEDNQELPTIIDDEIIDADITDLISKAASGGDNLGPETHQEPAPKSGRSEQQLLAELGFS